MSKEINGLLNLYLEINEDVLINTEDGALRNINTNYKDNQTNLIHDFLYELLETNQELIKKYGFKEINFQVHEAEIQNI